MNDDEFDRACRFLNALATALQRYGVSSRGMESLLARVAQTLRLRGEFLATPTQVQSVLWREGDTQQRLHVVVSNAGSFDLTKLTRTIELMRRVESGALAPQAGLDTLRLIETERPAYGARMDAVAFVMCGLAFGVILGLSWSDALLGGGLSLVSFGVVQLAARSQGLSNALELVVALIVSVLAALLTVVLPGSNPFGVAVCALIYLVPGFGLTLGASELMAGNTLSGLVGFTRAAVGLVKLLAGVVIGTALVFSRASLPVPDVHSGVAHGWTWLFVPMLVLGLAILFRVRRKDLIWPLLGALVVWLALEAGTPVGYWQGTFIGTFALISVSRVFRIKSKLPPEIILLPSVMLLVPGVPTLRAFYVAETQGIVEGLHSFAQVGVVVAAILGGLLFAEGVWAIRRPRFPPIFSGSSRTRSEEHP